MTHNNDQLGTPSVPGPLTDPALLRYLSPQLAADLSDPQRSARTEREVFVQLVCAHQTISTYLPRHLIERELSREAQTLAGPWLEWVDGALLFADVSGSTALAERLTALGHEGTEIVTGVLNDFFDTMIAVCDSFGGDLISFGGDALLIFFDGAQPALTATAAALQLLDRLTGFERHVPGLGTFPLTLHIGVERGRVALASAGQSDSRRYCAIGSTVNGVARAEGYGGKGELVLGPNAWHDVAAYAAGVEVAPGYWRVSQLRADAVPPLPTPAPQPPTPAIPALLRQLEHLSPYLPAGLLPRIVADPQRPQVEADLRPVTVLFAQVVGLAPIVEALDETRAAVYLDAILQPVQAVIERFGGVVNKVDLADEGDKLLAIFGAPQAYEDHAQRAALAALAILEYRRQAIANDLMASGPLAAMNRTSPLRVRIGINTGTVFAGNVGTSERKEYTVMGDAVNVAARVMSRAAWGEVWCSGPTASMVADRLDCADRGRVPVKGKAEPLQLFQITGEHELLLPSLDQQTPLVGRQGELALLHEQLEQARAGQGRVARVVGEAGMGKSRLVATLLEEARQHGMAVTSVTCLSYAAGIPYDPWGGWLRQLCGIDSGASQSTRLEQLAATLRTLGPGQEEWLPLLADLVRLDLEDSRLTRALDPQLRQARTFELLVALVRGAAGSAGAIILFEDLHWADQISLDLWQRVATSIGDVPLLLLGVHRPGLSWGSGSQDDGAYLLTLRELPEADSQALITARLGAAHLPLDLREQLVARAAGNPLFLEELLRATLTILESDAAGGKVAEQRVENASQNPKSKIQNLVEQLPDSLNGLLLARIDRLDESSRAVLRVASVIGQRFPVGVLQAVGPADQRSLLRQLTRLDEEDLTLTEREQPERIHIFRHALLQEVAYQSLLYSRRRELHRRIGEYLERRYADHLERYYGLLAHHYRLSDQRERALNYLLLAGNEACHEYANDDAVQYYRWAEEILYDAATASNFATDPRRWVLHNALGDVLSTVGRYDEALAQYDAIVRAEPPPALAVVAEALRDRGSALEKRGQYAEALEELTRAEELCRDHLDEVPPLLLSEISADMGLVLMRRGEYDLAHAICGEGLNMMRRDVRSREDERIEARLHALLGQIYGTRGDYPQARHHFGSALAAQEAIDDLAGMCRSNNNIGYLWQLQGEYERAIEQYGLAEQFARKINLRYMLIFVGVNTAYALYHLARYEEAERQCLFALEICRSINDQRNIAQIEETLGLIAYCRGQYRTALDHYAITRGIHTAAGSLYPEANTWLYEAAAHTALGQPEQALALANQSLARAEELQAQQLRLEALNALAEACLAANNQGAAAGYAGEAQTLAESLGSKFDLAVAERLLGESTPAGETHFTRSVALFKEIKQRFELGRSYAAYARLLHRKGNLPAVHTYVILAQEIFIAIGAEGELARLQHEIERSV